MLNGQLLPYCIFSVSIGNCMHETHVSASQNATAALHLDGRGSAPPARHRLSASLACDASQEPRGESGGGGKTRVTGHCCWSVGRRTIETRSEPTEASGQGDAHSHRSLSRHLRWFGFPTQGVTAGKGPDFQDFGIVEKVERGTKREKESQYGPMTKQFYHPIPSDNVFFSGVRTVTCRRYRTNLTRFTVSDGGNTAEKMLFRWKWGGTLVANAFTLCLTSECANAV